MEQVRANAKSRSSSLLVVDDETEPRQALALLLTSAGFRVEQAASAENAEEVLARKETGIVLVDADMPGVNGFEACRRIRKTCGSSVYVILRATKEQLFAQELSVDEGADDFLIEPVTDKEILARVETGRKMKQLQEKLEETNRSLAQLEVSDPLTGAYNKQRIDAEIDREMERARRYGRAVSLLVLDIDGFRQLNEKLGRGAGDRALEEIARIVRLCTRATDSVGRRGGEEFAVVLPETGTEQAVAAAEKIRKVIGQTTIAAGEQTFHVTVSIGVATFQNNNYAAAAELVAAAEKALAGAKAAGRNRTKAG